jgi:hypothetical protein
VPSKNHSKGHQERVDSISKENEIPEDIQDSWYKFCRSMQAKCVGNSGIATITVEIGVIQTEAISWAVKDISKVYPARLSEEVEFSDKGIAALLAHLSSGSK